MDADIRPSERRFSNPLALAVLVLLYERPMHPYEMATTLRERGKEQSIKLNYGSLYTVIEQLLREQWIGVKEILKEGRRPEKTIYELKPAGETELIDWMRELVSSPVKEYPAIRGRSFPAARASAGRSRRPAGNPPGTDRKALRQIR